MGEPVKIEVSGVNFYYGTQRALHDVNMKVREHFVTALIGPSGCGKSTFLRSLNRMNDLIPGARLEGRVNLEGEDIYSPSMDVIHLRRRVGMIFQRSNPFPMSIFDNVAYALREQGSRRPRRDVLRPAVERALRRAGLWDEVKDDLDRPALRLSGGQQQRLCIARAVAVQPEVVLFDEPTSALDPISTAKIEELIAELKSDYTIAIVTHNMQQAARVSDYTAYMSLGELVEFGETDELFLKPKTQATEDYITGRFG